MKTTARLIITLKCNRKCEGCCNTYQSLISKARFVTLEEVINGGYEEICVTGGEPLLKPERTLRILKELKAFSPSSKRFLYTALYHPRIWEVLYLVDGVQFSVHVGAGPKERDGFEFFQSAIGYKFQYQQKSFRLFVDNRVGIPLRIYPWLWKRVEVKDWIPEGNCPLPENEELLILKDERFGEG